MTRSRILLVAVSLLLPSLCLGQSLAEVARAEELRRKAVSKPAKTYTNADLQPDATRPVPAPPATQAASGVPPSANASAPAPADPAEPARDQAYWSARMSAARQLLERSRMFADALQSRINALSTDFVNRDDPAQREQISQDRQKAMAELDRVKLEIAEQTKVIAEIEEEARKAGVPPGWLR